jgi:hypothetical protein
MAALLPAPWQRRRLAAWLPLAAGLALAVVGLVLSGGIPAPGVMSTLPAAAGGVLGWIVSSVLDTLAVARGGTDAARAMVATGGFSLLLWLAAAAVCGSWAVVALVGRTRGGQSDRPPARAAWQRPPFRGADEHQTADAGLDCGARRHHGVLGPGDVGARYYQLAPGAVVHGDVVALGGNTFGTGRATGRVVGLGSLGFGARGQAARPAGSVAWGRGLLRIGLWVIVGSLLLLLAPRAARGAGEQVVRQLWQTPMIGVLGLLVWFVTVVLALGVTATPLSAGCLLLAVALLLLAKVVGVVGVAWVLGKAAVPALPAAWRGELPRTGIAILVLATLSAVPLLGAAVWLIVNVLGVGAVVGAVLHRLPVARPLTGLAAR